jgi:hypothetical protein
VPRELLRKFSQNVAILAHHLLSHFHLVGKFFVVRSQFQSSGCFSNKQGIAFVNVQPFEQFFGQYDADRIADRGDLNLGNID